MNMSIKLDNTNTSITTILCLLIALWFSHGSAAQLNKCKINGKTEYTDKACPDNTAEKLDLSKSSFSTTPALAPSAARAFTSTSRNSSSSRISSPGWLHDESGYQKALKISAKEKTPIFVYGYTDWCGFCKKLQRDIFQDSSVQKVLDRFIKVKINPEHSAADKALFNSWGGRGYPTLYIQPNSNSSPARTSGPFTKKNGIWELMTKSDFIAMLRSSL